VFEGVKNVLRRYFTYFKNIFSFKQYICRKYRFTFRKYGSKTGKKKGPLMGI